jgi:thiol-disulfide isomerase/thioredoxin
MKKILVLILFFNFSNVLAAEFNSNFTQKIFETAQRDGKTVVVYSWNEFCGTCAKQKPILTQAKLDFSNVLFLDFEQTKNKDAAKFLNINYWSTIAVYKNNKQVKKSIGLINKNDIYALIKEGI